MRPKSGISQYRAFGVDTIPARVGLGSCARRGVLTILPASDLASFPARLKNTVSDPIGDGYDSDTSGCSSSSEDLIVLPSAVAAASAFMYILLTYAITGSHSNGMHSGTRGGSTPRRAGNRERCTIEGAACMDADYFRRGMLLGELPLLTSAISNGGRLCLMVLVVVRDFFEEKADCCGRPSATVVRLLNLFVGRKKSLPHNFADLGDQPYH
jgi:hypothetical protein